MNLLKAIGTGFKWFFGGNPAGGVSSSTVVDKLDEVHFSEEEKAGADAADLANARAFQSGPAGPGFFNQFVDAWSRSIRPGVTTWLFGGWAQWWELPSTEAIDPFWQTVTYVVLTFWFGGRVVMKDVPKMLTSLAVLRAQFRKN